MWASLGEDISTRQVSVIVGYFPSMDNSAGPNRELAGEVWDGRGDEGERFADIAMSDEPLPV